jgi:hypothetical protein
VDDFKGMSNLRILYVCEWDHLKVDRAHNLCQILI